MKKEIKKVLIVELSTTFIISAMMPAFAASKKSSSEDLLQKYH